MRIAYALVLLAACGSDSDMLPGGGGSGSGLPDSGTGGTIDSRIVDARVIDGSPLLIDAAVFSGRVCLLTDARDFDTCATTGAGNLTVHIGASSAVTAADGTFKIAAPATAANVWSVTGSSIVSSYKVKNDYFIQAMTHTMFDSLTAANLPAPGIVAGEGSIMVHVIHDGTGYAGATATAAEQTNPAKYLPRYDNNASQTQWNSTPSSTGSQGAVWLAGFDVGTAQFEIIPPGSTTGVEDTQPVADQGITWVDVIFN